MKKLSTFIAALVFSVSAYAGAKLLHPTNVPNSTTLPATCSAGDMYMDTNATTGQRFYLCESANTWVLQGDGTAGGGDSVTVNGAAVTDPDFKDGDIDFTNTSSTITATVACTGCIDATDLAANSVANSEMADDAIGAAEMADADHGDVSWSDGVATVDSVAAANVAAGSLGASVIASSVAVNAIGSAQVTDASLTADDLGADSVSASELNATGVEAELEAVLDLNELQGQIGDTQIADGAVDGGTGGEIADGTITAADLGTDSVSADELNATGVEAELEAVLDLADQQGNLALSRIDGGVAGANVYDFGGATSVEMVNGTNPAVDTTGEYAVDTSSGQVVVSTNGSTGVVIVPYDDWEPMTIETPAIGDFPFFFRPLNDITVSSLVCISSAATSATIQVEECDADGANCAAINTAAACATTNTTLTLTDTAITAGNRLRVKVTAVSGTPGWVAVDLYYRETRK